MRDKSCFIHRESEKGSLLGNSMLLCKQFAFYALSNFVP